MYRYIGMVWNEADDEANAAAKFLTAHFGGLVTKWEIAYDGAGLRVLHTGEEKNRMQAYPIRPQEEGCGGVVLGKLFDKPSDPSTIPGNAELNTPEARKIIHSQGRHLVDQHWGSWVAFFQDRQTKYVLVDPIGTFCCFSTNYRGVELYFTHMNDVAACEFLNFSINWIPIASQLRYSLEKTKTGLNEVTKVLSGQCLSISASETVKNFYWNPQKISQTDVIEDADEAEAALRQVILTATAAWTAPYDKVLHQIGGLDSSILLACLKKVPTSLDVTALNIFHDHPMGDERYYASKAASHVEIPLIEYLESPTILDIDLLADIPSTTVPIYYAQQLGVELGKSLMVQKRGIQAVFTGHGGDEILCAEVGNAGAIDYLKSRGLRPHLLKLAMEAARMQNVSVWSILPKILHEGFSKKTSSFYNEFDFGTDTLLSADFQRMISPVSLEHPWVRENNSTLPGKIAHISQYTMGIYAREYLQDTHVISPLLSQTVVETCLRIPTWLMAIDGKSRGLARKAFRHHLPPEVIWRQSKLSASSHLQRTIDANAAFQRECLLDGVLVAENIINKTELEKTLNKDSDIGDRNNIWLMLYVNAEIWARKWKGRA